MITIIETAQFIKKSKQIMTQAEKDDLLNTIARSPKAGEVIPKTGGVRKLRVAREGQGKSGSFRLIYYYYDKKNPVFLFTVYGKNEKANITDAEKHAYYKGIQILKKEMKP
ncbi:type II toxin-antitoxin system RelE/ParE family toxin [Nitrospira sp. M1]